MIVVQSHYNKPLLPWGWGWGPETWHLGTTDHKGHGVQPLLLGRKLRPWRKVDLWRMDRIQSSWHTARALSPTSLTVPRKIAQMGWASSASHPCRSQMQRRWGWPTHAQSSSGALLIIALHDCPVKSQTIWKLPKIMEKKSCIGNLLKFSLALIERTIHDKLLA